MYKPVRLNNIVAENVNSLIEKMDFVKIKNQINPELKSLFSDLHESAGPISVLTPPVDLLQLPPVPSPYKGRGLVIW